MKVAALRGHDAVSVNLMVRISGVILTGVLLALAGTAPWGQPHLSWAALIGLAAGLFTFTSGYAGLKALDYGSLNATWSLMRASTVMPVIASMVIWGELHNARDGRQLVCRLVGIVCLLTALVLLGRGRRE